jgi:hypothetical protein
MMRWPAIIRSFWIAACAVGIALTWTPPSPEMARA